MNPKIRKIKEKQRVLEAKIQLTRSKVGLAKQREELFKIRSTGFGFGPSNVVNFIERGRDITRETLGLKRRKIRRR